jgi:hypothetical protein
MELSGRDRLAEDVPEGDGHLPRSSSADRRWSTASASFSSDGCARGRVRAEASTVAEAIIAQPMRGYQREVAVATAGRRPLSRAARRGGGRSKSI